MTRLPLILIAISMGTILAKAQDRAVHTFQKIKLTDKFWAEGANYGDFNHDGQNDVVAGPYWYEGPDFKQRHEYSPATETFLLKHGDGTEEKVPGFEGALGHNNAYSDNFFAFTYDFNADGWDDILIYGFPGKDASWYENPARKDLTSDQHWIRHQVFGVVDNESPTWGDLTGDGKPEICSCSGGYLGYASPDWSNPAKPWTFHPISPKGNYQRFTHGYGYGDVNGDGRKDVLEAGGWWEQPASLAGDPIWKKHPYNFGSGGAQMYVYDVNGDGWNDIITSLAAHQYGLAWFEQTRDKDEISFRQHLVVGEKPDQNAYGLVISQMHALDLIDMDGDGLKDIVTGKRFWAHGSHGDADPSAPAVLYWFKLVRHGSEANFVPYLIDDDSGVGTQVVAGKINGDPWPDVVLANKKGAFVFLHQVKNVDREEWEKAQPKSRVTSAGQP